MKLWRCSSADTTSRSSPPRIVCVWSLKMKTQGVFTVVIVRVAQLTLKQWVWCLIGTTWYVMDTMERKGAGSKKREIIPEICSLKQETCFSSPRAVTFKSGLKSTVDIYRVLKKEQRQRRKRWTNREQSGEGCRQRRLLFPPGRRFQVS